MALRHARQACVSLTIAAIAVFAMTISTAADAAVYVVNNRAIGASDFNPGTESKPWKTIGKASRTVRPGDRVVVRPGFYPERINFYGRNLANASTQTFFDAIPSRGATMYGFDTQSAPKLVIRGFNITIPKSLLSTDWTARYAIFVRSNGVHIQSNTIRDVPGAGISGYWVQPWPTDVNIFLNTLVRVNQGIIIHGDRWNVGSNHVRQLVVYNMDCDYIRFFGRDIKIRRNYLYGTKLAEVGNSHVDGFQTFPNNGYYVDGALIEGNIVESFHQGAMVGVGQWAQMTGYLRNMEFTNNIFIGGDIGGSWGIQAVHTTNVKVTHNLFMNLKSGGAGVYLRDYATGTVQNNTFFNAGHNYYKDGTSTMTGGYNILNRTYLYPQYKNANDLVADPLMWNAAAVLGPDRRPWTADDGYQLRTTSPALNRTGGTSVARDIFFSSRPQGARADAGPHEYLVSVAKSDDVARALETNIRNVSGSEPITISLSNAAPIETTTLRAEVPPALQSYVRVEWQIDRGNPHEVSAEIIPIIDWKELLVSLGMEASPFEVSIGNRAMDSGKLLFALNNR